jgi:hypothetical protein
LAAAGPFLPVVAIVIALVVVIVILIALFRVFWVMMRTYVVVVMLVAISPFVFLYGIVKDGINAMWFKLMFANLSIFFTVGAMMLFANILIHTTAGDADVIGAIGTFLLGFLNPNPYDIQKIPELSGNAVMPGFTSFGGTDIIGSIVALGLFISTPKFASSIRDWIQTGRVPQGGLSPSVTAGAAIGGAAGLASPWAGQQMEKFGAIAKNRKDGVTSWDVAREGGKSEIARYVGANLINTARNRFR